MKKPRKPKKQDVPLDDRSRAARDLDVAWQAKASHVVQHSADAAGRLSAAFRLCDLVSSGIGTSDAFDRLLTRAEDLARDALVCLREAKVNEREAHRLSEERKALESTCGSCGKHKASHYSAPRDASGIQTAASDPPGCTGWRSAARRDP